MKVVHLIGGLAVGGAELMLARLIRSMDRRRFENVAVSLTYTGTVGEMLTRDGFEVNALGISRGSINPRGIVRLNRILAAHRPDVLQTWMYHADLLGGLAARLRKRTRVVWNIRASDLNVHGISSKTRGVVRACAVLSRVLPDAIVCGSEAARRVHETLGYARERMVVIPNGFDTELFRPDVQARKEIREELRLPEDALVVGLIGRFDPLKDHRTFVAAAEVVAEKRPEAHFVLCGRGVTRENDELMGWIRAAGIEKHVSLMGERSDISRIANALDVGCLSSYSEGFPNVVGELMATGVPCVATNVGDASVIIGETGYIVKARDPVALGEACIQMFDLGRSARVLLGERARLRIEQEFSLPVIVRRYEQLYEDVTTNN